MVAHILKRTYNRKDDNCYRDYPLPCLIKWPAPSPSPRMNSLFFCTISIFFCLIVWANLQSANQNVTCKRIRSGRFLPNSQAEPALISKTLYSATSVDRHARIHAQHSSLHVILLMGFKKINCNIWKRNTWTKTADDRVQRFRQTKSTKNYWICPVFVIPEVIIYTGTTTPPPPRFIRIGMWHIVSLMLRPTRMSLGKE